MRHHELIAVWDNFDGGYNDSKNPLAVRQNEFALLKNCHIERGAIHSDEGMADTWDSFAIASPQYCYRGAYNFVERDGTIWRLALHDSGSSSINLTYLDTSTPPAFATVGGGDAIPNDSMANETYSKWACWVENNNMVYIMLSDGATGYKFDPSIGDDTVPWKMVAPGLTSPNITIAEINAGSGEFAAGEVYEYKFVFYNSTTGAQSLVSSALSHTVTAAGGNVDLQITIPASLTNFDANASDKIHIYRTTDGSTSEYYYMTPTGGEQAYVGSQVTPIDSTHDDDLSANDALSTDVVDVSPPTVRFGVNHNRRLYASGNSTFPDRIYFSELNQLHDIKSVSWVALSSPGWTSKVKVTGLASFKDNVWAFTENAHTILDGTEDPENDLRTVAIAAHPGCLSFATLAATDNLLIWVSRTGIWATDGSTPRNISEGRLDEFVETYLSDPDNSTAMNSATRAKNLSAVVLGKGGNFDYYLHAIAWDAKKKELATATTSTIFRYNIQKDCWTFKMYENVDLPNIYGGLAVYTDTAGTEDFVVAQVRDEHSDYLLYKFDEGYSTLTYAQQVSEVRSNWFGNPSTDTCLRELHFYFNDYATTSSAHNLTLKIYKDKHLDSSQALFPYHTEKVKVPQYREEPHVVPVNVTGRMFMWELSNTDVDEDFSIFRVEALGYEKRPTFKTRDE